MIGNAVDVDVAVIPIVFVHIAGIVVVADSVHGITAVPFGKRRA